MRSTGFVTFFLGLISIYLMLTFVQSTKVGIEGTKSLTYLGRFGNKTYFKNETLATREESRLLCETDPGDQSMELIHFDSQEEFDYVTGLLYPYYYFWTSGRQHVSFEWDSTSGNHGAIELPVESEDLGMEKCVMFHGTRGLKAQDCNWNLAVQTICQQHN